MATRRWFHPHITGQKAEELLMEQGQDGSFLCRPSQTVLGDFSLSVRCGDTIKHIKIQNSGDYYDLYGGEKFATLGELVSFYTETPGALHDHGVVIELKNSLNSEEITAERWFHSSLTGREAETLLLSKGQDGSFLVRTSVHNPGSYVISARVEEGVSHVIIRNIDGKFDIGQGGRTFSSLSELVEHYKKSPMVLEGSGIVIHLKHPFHATSFLPVNILPRIVELQKRTDDFHGKTGFWQEFEQLQKQECKHLYSRREGARPENKPKNRYKNILPFDHTRVVLEGGDPNTVGSDYINANYISGEVPGSERKYIATQGCKQATVDDFWRMVWQENTRVIFMTTNELERGKNKCTRYWPELDQSCVYGKVHVFNSSEVSNKNYALKELLVHNEDVEGDNRTIYHFHFKAWPDHGTPTDPGAVLGVLQDINLKQSSAGDGVGPIIVHCSAGIGRTGTVIVIDIIINFISDQGWDEEIDIQKSILIVRTQRSGMVQTEQQYKFVYTAIQHYIDSKNTLMQVDGNYDNLKQHAKSNSREAAATAVPPYS